MYLSIALFAPALALETGKVGQNISIGGLTFRFTSLVQYYFKWLVLMKMMKTLFNESYTHASLQYITSKINKILEKINEIQYLITSRDENYGQPLVLLHI